MATNKLLPFANDNGANVESYANWLALTQRGTGFVSGVATSKHFNYILAQGGSAGYTVGQFVADYAAQDADLNAPTLYTNFKTALINFFKASIVGFIYPVGTIYCSTDSTNPATKFGVGTWVRIGEGRGLIDAGSTFLPGSTGGNSTHTITVGEMPSHNHGGTSSAGGHTHTRGTMNITGQTYGEGGGSSDYGCYQGAFYIDNSSGIRGVGSGDTDRDNRRILFEAARSWSGATSENGSHTHTVTAQGGGASMNIMNPYLAVYIWKRTA